ncbi:uncharacterized protein [Argopecten irradians]|uniref:uncharacterized protein n=1 Tax=Argopecten irradians TaxID=31199 RepID=UPI003719B656
MAEDWSDDIGTMSLTGLLNKLMAMTQPVPNDKRQDQYCGYINTLISAYGIEHCQVVGSTKDGTRLRSEQDEGDYDYILYCNFVIPVESLEYIEDLPCFVHIKGSFMGEEFSDRLIDGEYLPTWLLKDMSPLAFPLLKGIFDVVSRSDASHGRHTPRLAIKSSMKPGYNLTNYAGWDCKDLPVKPNVRSASERDLLQQFEERRKRSEALTEDVNNVVPSFAAVLDMVQNMKSKDTSSGLIYQQFGPVLGALSGNVSGMSNKRLTEDDTKDRQDGNLGTQKKAKIQSLDEAAGMTEGHISSEEAHTKRDEMSTAGTSKNIKNSNGGEEQTEVYATYTSKSDRDYIPAARLSGPPKFIEGWKQRVLRGYWPRPQAADAISKSQFFVVVKPANTNEKPEKDFCLSCNLAEIVLVKELPPGHKKCLLMIKAFQRTILEEYSKVLASFHWKTAMYWMLESTDPTTYSEHSEDILNVLRDLLDYMRDRLHEGWLQHYFFPSNLFAGFDRAICVDIVKKLEDLHSNPEFYLRSFFCLEREKQNKRRVIKLSAENLKTLRNDVVDKRDESALDAVANALEGFAKPASTTSDGKPKVPVQNLLIQIAETALTDEENRRKEEEAKDPSKAVTPTVSKDNLMDSVKDLVSKLGADKRTRKEAEKEATKMALAYFLGGKT